MDSTEVIERIHTKLDQPIPEFSSEDLIEFEEYLGIDANHKSRDVILGLMTHFTPEQAMALQKDETPRSDDFEDEIEPYVMIEEYLVSEYGVDEQLARSFSHQMGQMWDDWFTDGRYISYADKITEKLKKDQKQRCANCHVTLDNEEKCITYQNEDIFKPIHHFSQSQTTAELDHIEPLSQFGGNRLDNLQVLCRFCNRGKGNGKHIPVLNQMDYAVGPVDAIPKGFRRKIFYSVTAEYDSCQSCGSRNDELTVRLKSKQGCFVVSNLRPICVECVFEL